MSDRLQDALTRSHTGWQPHPAEKASRVRQTASRTQSRPHRMAAHPNAPIPPYGSAFADLCGSFSRQTTPHYNLVLLPIQIRKGLWPELFENRPAASPAAQSLQGNSKNFHPIIQGGIITDERKTDTTAAGGKDRIAAVRSEAELQEVKALLLGKQGSLTGLLKELPKLDAALRPEMGKAVNQPRPS